MLQICLIFLFVIAVVYIILITNVTIYFYENKDFKAAAIGIFYLIFFITITLFFIYKLGAI